MTRKYKYNTGDRTIHNLLILEQTIIKTKSKITKSGYTHVKAYIVLCEKHNKTFIKSEDNVNTNCKLCALNDNRKNVEDREYKFEVGGIIHNNLLIVEKTFCKSKGNSTVKAYKVKCLSDGYEYIKSEYHIEKYNCPVCYNRLIIKGINDIATTHPHLIKYFLNIEDAYKYSYSSDKKVKIKCLNCGNINTVRIADLSKGEFGCSKCSDGISYPNKFVFNLLEQLDILFETEKTFDWSNNKRYDFYIPSLKCIIEAHGEQHYKETTLGRTLAEEQENDKLKQQLALENDIEHYIALDCRRSELEWIKESVINSELPTLFNFNKKDINWVKCHEISLKNIVKIICDDYKSGNYTTYDLSIKYKKHKSTIVKYLVKGTKLKWCDYNSELELLKTRSNLNHDGKEILVVETNTIFPSLSELCRQSLKVYGVKFNAGSVSRYVDTDNKYKGFTFKYTGNITKYIK